MIPSPFSHGDPWLICDVLRQRGGGGPSLVISSLQEVSDFAVVSSVSGLSGFDVMSSLKEVSGFTTIFSLKEMITLSGVKDNYRSQRLCY